MHKQKKQDTHLKHPIITVILNSINKQSLHVTPRLNTLLQQSCLHWLSLQYELNWLRLPPDWYENCAVSGNGKTVVHTCRANKEQSEPNAVVWLGSGAEKSPIKLVLGVGWLHSVSKHSCAVFNSLMSSQFLYILLISVVMNSDGSAVWINYTSSQLDTVHACYFIWLQHQ